MHSCLRNFAIMAALSLSSVAMFAAKIKLDVTVIENIPSTTTYGWLTRGGSPAPCSGNSCSSYSIPANSGTSQVTGATLKLLLPDGRIVIARCVANMGGSVFAIIGAVTRDDHLNDPRNCGVPPSGQPIQAEFNGETIKLSWHLPGLDGTGRKTGETYYLTGVLKPTGSSTEGTTSSLPSQSAAPVSAPNPAPIQAQAPAIAQSPKPITAQAPVPSPMTAQTPRSTPSRVESVSPAPSSETVPAQTPVPNVKQQIKENQVVVEKSSPLQPAPFQDGPLSQQAMLRQIKTGKASRCAIATTPAGAEVYVDGKFAGKAPLTIVLMQHDRYREIMVKATGYRSYETQVWPNGADLSLGPILEAGGQPIVPSQR